MGCATSILRVFHAKSAPRFGALVSALAGLFPPFLSQGLSAPTNSPPGQFQFAAEASANFEKAQARYKNEPRNTEAAWQFARACFDLADLATNDAQRATIAQTGIAVCEQALTRDSNSAPTHYYLGMNLAQLAQTKGLSALKIVEQMRREFSLTRDLDERFDYAGADRNLGLLYRDAPALISIGNRDEAKLHLLRAVQLAPQYPENRLNLIEAELKWDEREAANRQLAALEKLWPAARTNFTGPAWLSSWADWEPRLARLKKKIKQSSKTLQSPRH